VDEDEKDVIGCAPIRTKARAAMSISELAADGIWVRGRVVSPPFL
jgi:hypothetical protein